MKKVQDGSTRNRLYFIHAAIAITIMIFFRFIPPFGEMTPLGMELLGIFIGLLWAWIKCDMVWPSVLAFIFLGFSSYTPSGTVSLSAAFGNPLIQLILWLLVFSAILMVSGISEQIAQRLIASKYTKGRPWVLSIVILAAVYVGAAFGAAFALILICWEFVYVISEQVGYSKDDKWPKMMIVSIVFTSCVGLVVMPFSVGVVATFGYLTAASDGLVGNYNYFSYLIFGLFFSFVILAIFMLINKYIVRPDLSKLREVNVDMGEIPPFNTKQKLAVGALIVLVLVTVLPSILPANIQAYMNMIGTPLLVLAVPAFITIFRDKQGKPYFTFQELASGGIFWNMMFMVAAAITMGSAISSPEAGFNATFISAFMPILSGMSPYMFTLVIIVVTLILTNLINNAVTGAIMVPLMYSFSTAVGANPLLITALIIFASNLGLLLPSASPVGAMLAGNKEWIKPNDVFYYCSLYILAVIIAVATIGIPIGNLFFQ